MVNSAHPKFFFVFFFVVVFLLLLLFFVVVFFFFFFFVCLLLCFFCFVFFIIYSTTSISGSLSNVCGYVLALVVRSLDFCYLAVEADMKNLHR